MTLAPVRVSASIKNVTEELSASKQIIISADFEVLFRHEATRPSQVDFGAVMQAFLHGEWKLCYMDVDDGYHLLQKELNGHVFHVRVCGAQDVYTLTGIRGIRYFEVLTAILRASALKERAWNRVLLRTPQLLSLCCLGILVNAGVFYFLNGTPPWWSVVGLSVVGLVLLNLPNRRSRAALYKAELSRAQYIIQACS